MRAKSSRESRRSGEPGERRKLLEELKIILGAHLKARLGPEIPAGLQRATSRYNMLIQPELAGMIVPESGPT